MAGDATRASWAVHGRRAGVRRRCCRGARRRAGALLAIRQRHGAAQRRFLDDPLPRSRRPRRQPRHPVADGEPTAEQRASASQPASNDVGRA